MVVYSCAVGRIGGGIGSGFPFNLLGATMGQPITDRIMQWITRRNMSRLVFYVACVVLSALAYKFEDHMQHATYGVLAQVPIDSQPGSLNEAEKGQISAFLQMNQLITTLGTT